MPTVTAIALDSFLEPSSRTTTAPKPPPAPCKNEQPRPVPAPMKNTAHWPHASPALYTTPESTLPLPDSPSSFPPSSPYIINHKRRGPRLLKALLQNDVGSGKTQPPPLPVLEKGSEASNGGTAKKNGHEAAKENGSVAEKKVNGCNRKLPEGEQEVRDDEQMEFQFQHGNLEDVGLSNGILIGDLELVKPANVNAARDGENDDFFDPQDSLSTTSNMEADDANGLERSWKPSTPVGEFYDAFEEISSDSAARSSRNIEDELREMRLGLLMEIERRKQAEEALESLQGQWKRLGQHLSLVGLTLPNPSTASERAADSSIDVGAELCQQVTVSRFVAAAIARACAHAEVASEMEPVIASKNFEMARLTDRVQYYEAANREMSQRNQEAIEMARQQRNNRKRRQKWFWGSVGLAVTLGATAIAWSYLPASKPIVIEANNTATVDSDQC